MSYEFPSSPTPKRRGGGGMFFLIVLAIGGFLIFSKMGSGGPEPNPQSGAGSILDPPPRSTSDDGYTAERNRILDDSVNSTARKKMPSTGRSGAASDWNMQDAGVSKNGSATKPTNGKTQNGDWSMEDGPTKKNEDSNQFKFSNPPSKKPAKSGGDWSIDDVDPKKPAKKTEKGDWSIQDAGTNKK